MSTTRRGLFSSLIRPRGRVVRQSAPPPPATSVFWLLDGLADAPVSDPKTVAELLPWNCLGSLGSFCSTCVERCPEPGAIELSDATPVVPVDLCTGCGECTFSCPAPAPALQMVARPEGDDE